MIIKKYESEEEWLADRSGRITGTKVNGLIPKRGNEKKAGYYQLIADRLIELSEDEDPRERGKRLEPKAIKLFEKKTKKKVNTDLVIWVRDDNENIAISPDGSMGEEEAVEVKCLGSGKHIQAFLTQQIPKEYEDQVIQYFVVNDMLRKVYCVFYDPSLVVKKFFYITIARKQVADEVKEYLEYQRNTLREVDKIIAELTNF